MTQTRPTIPDDLAARVMFAADRTCCVCKNSQRKVQIHHIDEDPSHNAFENLAVLCNDCHSDAHTTHAFARNLRAEVIRLYNEAWRATVKARLEPSGTEPEIVEYRQEVLLQLSLLPHEWKNGYIGSYPGHFLNTGYAGSIWDMMVERAVHRYDVDEWRRYKPLFDEGLLEVSRGIEQILSTYGDAVPSKVKLAALRTTQALGIERTGYLTLPSITSHIPDIDQFFAMRFAEVIRLLRTFEAVVNGERRRLAGEA